MNWKGRVVELVMLVTLIIGLLPLTEVFGFLAGVPILGMMFVDEELQKAFPDKKAR